MVSRKPLQRPQGWFGDDSAHGPPFFGLEDCRFFHLPSSALLIHLVDESDLLPQLDIPRPLLYGVF